MTGAKFQRPKWVSICQWRLLSGTNILRVLNLRDGEAAYLREQGRFPFYCYASYTMCLAVYIASDYELPEIGWDESDPKFFVEIIDSHEARIDKHLKLPNVAYARSNQGCGCGFLKPVDMPEELLEPNELKEFQANYDALASYVQNMKKSGASCEIYVCW